MSHIFTVSLDDDKTNKIMRILKLKEVDTAKIRDYVYDCIDARLKKEEC